jgi:hypothetical protein
MSARVGSNMQHTEENQGIHCPQVLQISGAVLQPLATKQVGRWPLKRRNTAYLTCANCWYLEDTAYAFFFTMAIRVQA